MLTWFTTYICIDFYYLNFIEYSIEDTEEKKKKLLDILCASRRKKVVSDIDQIVFNDTIRIDTAYQLASLIKSEFKLVGFIKNLLSSQN